MYTLEWASSFNGFSKEEPMDLPKFANFFKEYLADRYFTYQTTSKKVPHFVVEMKQNQLPHLMGLQHWNNLEVKQPEKQYEKLISGEWDLDFIIAADNGAYKEFRERIEFLPYLYKLLYQYDCRVKLVNQNVGKGFNRRRAQLIFQRDGVKSVYVLELRQKTQEEDEVAVYVPISITVHRKNSNALRIKTEPLEIVDVLIDRIT